MDVVCKEVEPYLVDVGADEGNEETRRRVQAHLEICARCRQLAREQSAMRHQLRLLAARSANVTPPKPLWERAAASWDRRDARKTQLSGMRWALAGSSLTVFLLGAVWAEVAARGEFPVEAALRNFREVEQHFPAPEYVTADPDRAARWLRERLKADVPPVNLSLSEGELVGADVVALPGRRMGRLLYRVPKGIAAVYLAPGATHFARTSLLPIANRAFQVRDSLDVGMYGWDSNATGFGLLLPEPIGVNRSLAINAAQATEEREQ